MGKNEAKDSFDEPIVPYKDRASWTEDFEKQAEQTHEEAKKAYTDSVNEWLSQGIRRIADDDRSKNAEIKSTIRLSQPSPSTRTPLSELTLPELKVVSDFLGVRLNFECETQKPQWKETLRKKEAVGNEIRKRIQNINFGLL